MLFGVVSSSVTVESSVEKPLVTSAVPDPGHPVKYKSDY
jgi:hypothetical protein